MASGNFLFSFFPMAAVPPSANFGTPDTITAAEGFRPVLDFDASTLETTYFHGVMPSNYASGGLTIVIRGSMDSGNTGTKVVRLGVGLEKIAVGDALGAGGSAVASNQEVEATVDNTANNVFSATITFTNGAQMDSVGAGDEFRLRLQRKVSGLTGTNATGDYQFEALKATET